MKDTITEVSKYQKGWTGGLPETVCGLGSKVSQTTIQRDFIAGVVKKYNIMSISDIGAGDLNWIDHVKWPHRVSYKAFDLVPRQKKVKQFDILKQVPDTVDCLLCIWVLNHLPENHAKIALTNLFRSHSKYLIYTYEPRMWACTNFEPIESVVIRDRGKGDKRGNVELRLVKW